MSMSNSAVLKPAVLNKAFYRILILSSSLLVSVGTSASGTSWPLVRGVS